MHSLSDAQEHLRNVEEQCSKAVDSAMQTHVHKLQEQLNVTKQKVAGLMAEVKRSASAHESQNTSSADGFAELKQVPYSFAMCSGLCVVE